MMRRRVVLGATVLGAAAWPRSAFAFPEARPISIVVGVPPGGAIDIIARLLAGRLSVQLGQSVVVTNRPGGAYIPSVNAIRAAPRDGHTLLFANGGYAVISALPNAGFDIATDFAPISGVATGPMLLVTRPGLPRDLPGLLAHARANPGRLTCGNGGTGTLFHLAAELFQRQAGIEMLHVPYSGSAPAYQDLLAGRLDMAFDVTAGVLGMVNAGQLQAIAVATPRRLDVLPAVPTFSESGMAGFDPMQWFGLLAPAGTPAEIVTRLAAEVATAVAHPEALARLATLGTMPAAAGPEAFADMLRRDVLRWRQVIRDARLELG
jgi:tripartite-type tricarboxylate transporter receptor subunit TctC